MKFSARLMWFLSAFYVLASGGYTVWYANSYSGAFEPIGSAAIAMLAIMAAFIAFYLQMAQKRQGPVPEDRPDARIEDGDFEAGYFAPWSWWPLFVGLFASVCFASLAIGWWMFFIGFPLALVALIGFVFERSRGQNAH
jgi:hypothetical protein